MRLIARLVGLGFTLGALAPPLATSQTAATGPAPELSEVVVTGTRAALVESVDRKRNAQVVQDSIVAKDLGRFPDDNVADSLSHITGITLQRTRGGEGQFVNVRGLGPEFSIVTLNGRILATDGDGRDFAFDVLPSEVISGADVLKSAEASSLEGSIGGSINLRSARPLEGVGERLSLSAEVDYNDLSEDNGYKVSGVFSRNFMDDRMGLLVTAVYQDTEVRSDAVHEFFINPDSPGEFDADGDGDISEAESGLLGLCCTSVGARIQEKERSGVTATWQWDVNDSFRMTVDGLFTRLDAPTVGYHQSFYVEDSILDEGTGLHRWSDVSITDHWVDGMTVAELVPEISTITEYRVVDTTQFGWNGNWQASDRLHFAFDAYTSQAERNSGGKDTWVVSGIGGSHVGRVDMNPNGLPDISVTLDDGRDLAAALGEPRARRRRLRAALHRALGHGREGRCRRAVGGRRADLQSRGIHVAAVRRSSHGALQAARHRRERHQRRVLHLLQPVRRHVWEPRRAGRAQPVAAELHAQRRRELPDAFRPVRHSGSTSRRWPPSTAQPILDENGDPTGEVYDSSLVAPEFNPVQSYDVDEDTVAAYVSANFGADNWFANVGLRWIETDTTARTAVDAIVRVDDPTPNVPTSSPDVTYSPAEPFTQDGNYSKLLPSLNVGWWLREDLLLRAAVAQVISRPSLNQLAPTRTDGTLDRTYEVFYDGNADLEPVEADQADLSVEWYFTDKSLLSAAAFWKDLDGFITTVVEENVDIGVIADIGGAGDAPLLYDVYRPINGDTAEVYGFEFGIQHFFENGFGVRANYTYTDTEAIIDGEVVGPLEGVSESAYSAAVMFENDRWDAQLAADYSGRYVEVTDVVGGLSQYGDPITWVTASVAYRLTDQFTVSLEGRNLTDEFYRATMGRPDMLAGFETWGRSVLFGVTAKF